jgi:hypothetical protein
VFFLFVSSIIVSREVLIEENGKLTSLTNLNFDNLSRVMMNGGRNVISLTKDRTLNFDMDNPEKHGAYDLNAPRPNITMTVNGAYTAVNHKVTVVYGPYFALLVATVLRPFFIVSVHGD